MVINNGQSGHQHRIRWSRREARKLRINSHQSSAVRILQNKLSCQETYFKFIETMTKYQKAEKHYHSIFLKVLIGPFKSMQYTNSNTKSHFNFHNKIGKTLIKFDRNDECPKT